MCKQLPACIYVRDAVQALTAIVILIMYSVTGGHSTAQILSMQWQMVSVQAYHLRVDQNNKLCNQCFNSWFNNSFLQSGTYKVLHMQCDCLWHFGRLSLTIVQSIVCAITQSRRAYLVYTLLEALHHSVTCLQASCTTSTIAVNSTKRKSAFSSSTFASY
jgi:hypothetical protein